MLIKFFIRAKYNATSEAFASLARTPYAGNGFYEGDRSQTSRIERQRSNAMEARMSWEAKVHDLEVQLGIDRRWLPSDYEWKAAKQSIAHDNYRRAVDTLEGLMVARLLELQSIQCAGVCE